MGKVPRLKFECKCGKSFLLRQYNNLKSHLYTCEENNGYICWRNIFNYFTNEEETICPKWLDSRNESEISTFELDEEIFSKFRVNSKYFTLNSNSPEFSSHELN